MTEADVVYSDVKFVKSRKDNAEASSPAKATSSTPETSMMSPDVTGGSQQQEMSNGGSKVTPERVAIAVLCALLVAAVIALVFTSYENMQTTGHLHQMTTENKNLTEELWKAKTFNREQDTCLAFVNTTKPCSRCPQGWEQLRRQCYYFSSTTSTWEDARTECIQRGGDLVRIGSAEEQRFLVNNVKDRMKTNEDMFWIGLTDKEREGTWLWVDGAPLEQSQKYWGPGQPDDWKVENPDGEDCVRMGERSSSVNLQCWFDRSCHVPHKSICQKPAETGIQICV